MRTKKCGLIAVTAAVLLVTALLVTTCEGPFDLGGLLGGGSQRATLNLSLAGNDGRTIIPNITITSFSDLWLEIDDGTTQTPYTATTLGLLNALDLHLTLGESHNITLEAYTGGPKGTGVLAASGTGTITNAASGSNPLTITLNLESTGNGTFTFTINNPGGANTIDSGTFAITPLSGGDTVTSTAIVFGTPHSETLATGFYRVSFTYVKSRHQTRTINEILHVFTGIESTYTNTPAPLIKNNFDITFGANGGTHNGDLGINNVLTANWNSATLTGGTIQNPTPPASPGTDTFGGWFDTALPANGNEFTPGTTVVYKDWGIYARWIPATTDEVGLSIDFTNVEDQSGLLSTDAAASISYSQANSSTGVTITLSAAAGLNLSDYTIAWYLSEVTIGSALSTSNVFTINDVNFASLGAPDIQLVVELTPTGTGYTYNVNVAIEITEPTP
ncbi:MAG: hypothetical protein FWC01_08170 [Treponema sp.]|nr:hypothetical protein [Treponema sp.]MCL2238020.1 hypothetical protein [Treponema sp.]